MKIKIYLAALLFLPLNLFSQSYSPGDNELLLMPTAYTMPEKNSYFSDYELLLLNYSYAVTSSTHLSAFSFFPVTTQFYESFTMGFKQKVITYNSVQNSIYGTYTPKGSAFSLGDVVSIADGKNSFHFSVGYVRVAEDAKPFIVFMAGLRIDPSEKTSLMLEYENVSSTYEEGNAGMLSIGLRIRSTNMSWEIAGMRPLNYTGELLFIPLLKVGYYFN
ncbi:MAG: hypothetical protein WC209_07455 [Ignavibacteriaceae bacterium]